MATTTESKEQNSEMQSKEALIIGITGGIGSGKTTVAKIFADKGFKVIFTDELAKKIISENISIKNKITHFFGEKSFIDGKYNAEYISNLVFSGSKRKAADDLQTLGQIIHPTVIEGMINELEILQQNDEEMIFVESALIFELGLETGFDYVISVTAQESIRIQRIKDRTGLDEAQIKRRIASQITQEEKNKFADFVIENNKDFNELKKSVDFLLPILTMLPNKDFSSEEND